VALKVATKKRHSKMQKGHAIVTVNKIEFLGVPCINNTTSCERHAEKNRCSPNNLRAVIM